MIPQPMQKPYVIPSIYPYPSKTSITTDITVIKTTEKPGCNLNDFT